MCPYRALALLAVVAAVAASVPAYAQPAASPEQRYREQLQLAATCSLPALTGLLRLDPARGTADLRDIASSGYCERVHVLFAVREVADGPDHPAVALVRDALSDPDPSLRTVALIHLRELGDPLGNDTIVTEIEQEAVVLRLWLRRHRGRPSPRSAASTALERLNERLSLLAADADAALVARVETALAGLPTYASRGLLHSGRISVAWLRSATVGALAADALQDGRPSESLATMWCGRGPREADAAAMILAQWIGDYFDCDASLAVRDARIVEIAAEIAAIQAAPAPFDIVTDIRDRLCRTTDPLRVTQMVDSIALRSDGLTILGRVAAHAPEGHPARTAASIVFKQVSRWVRASSTVPELPIVPHPVDRRFDPLHVTAWLAEHMASYPSGSLSLELVRGESLEVHLRSFSRTPSSEAPHCDVAGETRVRNRRVDQLARNAPPSDWVSFLDRASAIENAQATVTLDWSGTCFPARGP